MTRATVILNGRMERARAVNWIASAPAGTSVEFKAPRRSTAANAKMWAMLTEVSRQVEWYGQKLTAEDWKDVFSASLRRARVVPGIDAGSFVPLGMRTSDMTVAEMAELIELISAFGAEHGVQFSDGREREPGQPAASAA